METLIFHVRSPPSNSPILAYISLLQKSNSELFENTVYYLMESENTFNCEFPKFLIVSQWVS